MAFCFFISPAVDGLQYIKGLWGGGVVYWWRLGDSQHNWWYFRWPKRVADVESIKINVNRLDTCPTQIIQLTRWTVAFGSMTKKKYILVKLYWRVHQRWWIFDWTVINRTPSPPTFHISQPSTLLGSPNYSFCWTTRPMRHCKTLTFTD